MSLPVSGHMALGIMTHEMLRAKVSIVLMGCAFPLLLASGCGGHGKGNRTIQSFSQAKVHVYAMHEGRPLTLYCGCPHQDRRLLTKECPFDIDPNKPRDLRTEIEHVVPMKRLGRHLDAWKKGHPRCVDGRGRAFKGRRCARKVSPAFRLMEADLYNLFPAIGTLNQRRGTKSFGEVPGEKRAFGGCDFEIEQRVEPRAAVRGDIARAYLYMAWAYPDALDLTVAERALYGRWSHGDPPDRFERERAAKIRALQRNQNPFQKE